MKVITYWTWQVMQIEGVLGLLVAEISECDKKTVMGHQRIFGCNREGIKQNIGNYLEVTGRKQQKQEDVSYPPLDILRSSL